MMGLTHWGRVTHKCVGKLTIIGSDNDLSPGRRQAIIWTNDGILLIGPLGTNFSEILIEIYTFSFKKIHLKVSSGKWRPSCLGLNVLKEWGYFISRHWDIHTVHDMTRILLLEGCGSVSYNSIIAVYIPYASYCIVNCVDSSKDQYQLSIPHANHCLVKSVYCLKSIDPISVPHASICFVNTAYCFKNKVYVSILQAPHCLVNAAYCLENEDPVSILHKLYT